MRLNTTVFLSVFASLAMGTAAFGAEGASGVVDLKSINGSGASQTFTYNITLKDTGTTNISSFWYAWIPPDGIYDFLLSKPTAETSPTGWIATLEGANNGTDDNSILWTTTSSPLTPGNSLTFSFTTPDNFTSINGPSTPYGFSRGYSFVYTNGPEAPGDGGAEFIVAAGSATPVPEPATLGVFGVGAALLCVRRRRRA